jgi:hypothetical protein
MNAQDFAEASHQEDKRAGRCPFCGAPGWITGDRDWCAHYAGTFDTLGDASPCYPFLQQEPFLEFHKAMNQIVGMTAEERGSLLATCSSKSRHIVNAALTYPEPLDFWRDFVPHELLFVETGKAPHATTYISLFVADLEEEKKRLVARVSHFLRETGFE